MDYKKKYRDALKKAETILKRGYYISGDLEAIFPELMESRDERIRKAIYIYLDWLDGRKDYAPRGEYSIRDMLAWLKKQKPSNNNNPCKDCINQKECINCENGNLKET